MPIANCTRNCWIAGAVTGLIVWLGTSGFGEMRWFEGLFLGLIAAGLTGRVLIWFCCEGTPASDGDEWTPGSGAGSRLRPEMEEPSGHGIVGSFAPMPQEVGPSGDAQLGTGAGSASDRNDIYSGRKSKANTSRSDDGHAPRVKGSGSNSAESKEAVSASGNAPESQGFARSVDAEAESDDLKQIKGVGPKMEERLIENGVTRFAQIAEWSETEIDHFSELIGGGRIRSDDWVSQARILARGGETEFSKRVDTGDVY